MKKNKNSKKYQGGTLAALLSLAASITLAVMLADGWWIALSYWIVQATFNIVIASAKWEVYNIDLWKEGVFTKTWADALRGGK